MTAIITDDSSAFQQAKTKALYGRKDWLVWKRRDGKMEAQPRTTLSLKAAMLESGTHQNFWCISANDGIGMIVSWSLGCLMLRNARYI